MFKAVGKTGQAITVIQTELLTSNTVLTAVMLSGNELIRVK